jgi:hypothetical protein
MIPGAVVLRQVVAEEPIPEAVMPFLRQGIGYRGGAGVLRGRTQPYVCCHNSKRDQPIPHTLGVFAQIVDRDQIVTIHTLLLFKG